MRGVVICLVFLVLNGGVVLGEVDVVGEVFEMRILIFNDSY